MKTISAKCPHCPEAVDVTRTGLGEVGFRHRGAACAKFVEEVDAMLNDMLEEIAPMPDRRLVS
jgi:hypothetical protein